ncbi:LysM peptidoglycan-binding domain-containing protein [uncultured Bacteroides sp.]|uniref:PBP1 and LysM peptidoglycan-binding domain-containing protein n=1 Tax=uncultured Bacteroides sp. TaxID=162156 RepID=UPI002AA69E32|nr:LysM peptidoglycan-binding domain-containing protein [uncultured Bacteroides sp.]
MRLIGKITILLFVLNFCYSVVSAQENSSYFLHTIEKGQNLYSISSMYGVSKADIINLNPGCEDKIYAGETLKIPQNKSTQKGEVFHTIKSGETLYRLTLMYKVSADAICSANPGLSAQNFQTGTVIRIPTGEESETASEKEHPFPTEPTIQPAVKSNCRDMHKIKRRETIFSISHSYNITEQELIAANPELKENKLEKGKYLCIPYAKPVGMEQQDKEATPPSNNELFSANKNKTRKLGTIKAAVILPFMLNGDKKNESARMVEYYEGFLMAIDSLKRTGFSIDLYTYDSGDENTSINPILQKKEMKDMDIIFGPLYQEHIDPLASFAKKNNIRLVIPFTSKDSEVFQNPSVYQINTPQSYLYSEVYEHFIRQFPNANIIIMETTGIEKDKVEFIKGLRQALKDKAIPVHTLKADATQDALKNALRPDKENIFIPTSGSSITLIRLIPQLKQVAMDMPEAKIHLFGYPEWQTYTKDFLASFFELDTYFYSSFYTNNLLPAAIRFTYAYRRWYTKEMANTYPKYGMLGFDTGFFFLKGLSEYGSGLERNLSKINLVPIQTGFKFQRVNNWGGFVNKKVFFVHFSKDFALTKLDFE